MTATRPVGECDGSGCDHYACKLRNNGIQVSPRVQMTRSQNWRPTPSVPPAFNKTIMYDERPGGIKSPILKADGTPLRRKEYGEKRHAIDAQLRARRQPTPTPNKE